MASKKERTRKYILERSHKLFAKKGFNAVTMKDVCEATNLSRGGLYSHFSSTQELFKAVIEELNKQDEVNFTEEMEKGIPATTILNNLLNTIKDEISHPEDYLSLAMYEYSCTVSKEFINKFSHEGEQKWIELIEYGISKGEFKQVNSEEFVTIILYLYNGVRMWSKVITMSPEKIDIIIGYIKNQLIKA